MKHWRETWKEDWASGKFTNMTNIQVQLANAEAVGMCRVVQLILDLDWDQVEGDLEDERERARE